MKYCSFASGSSGNVHFISSNNSKILVDVGKNAKYIKNSLLELDTHLNDIDAIVLTHEHVDHIMGLKVISKSLSEKVPIYVHRDSYSAILEKYDINHKNIIFIDDCDFSIKDLNFSPFKISHDARNCFGFTIDDGNLKMTIATDVGRPNRVLLDRFIKSDFVVVEANHEERLVEMGNYPYALKQRILGDRGHLSNLNCSRLLLKAIESGANFKHILLAHLSKEHNNPLLAKSTVVSYLEGAGIRDCDLRVEVAPNDCISRTFILEEI